MRRTLLQALHMTAALLQHMTSSKGTRAGAKPTAMHGFPASNLHVNPHPPGPVAVSTHTTEHSSMLLRITVIMLPTQKLLSTLPTQKLLQFVV
jgi:hypothetical protein